MRFMILMGEGGGSFERLSAAEQARVIERHGEVRGALEAEGKFVTSFRLAPSHTARTVTMDARGMVHVTDGPFAESKEVVGGIYVIEAETMDEAVEWGRRVRFIAGSNEVRPLFEG